MKNAPLPQMGHIHLGVPGIEMLGTTAPKRAEKGMSPGHKGKWLDNIPQNSREQQTLV
jgi:hypothetical protein